MERERTRLFHQRTLRNSRTPKLTSWALGLQDRDHFVKGGPVDQVVEPSPVLLAVGVDFFLLRQHLAKEGNPLAVALNALFADRIGRLTDGS